MANIGFKYAGYAERTESNNTVTFSNVVALQQGIKMEVKFDKVDTYLSAFDSKAEIDKFVTGATLDYECGYLTLEQEAKLLGHTLNESGEIAVSTTDSAPNVAFYAVAVAKINGVKKYDAYVFLKGMFGDSDISVETADAGGNVNYGTKTMSGTFTSDVLSGDKIYVRKICDSLEDAMSFVNSTFGVADAE